jgi:hypothetical protein
MTQGLRAFNATLEAGDCLFVPPYYYMESKTLTESKGEVGRGMSIILQTKHQSHSALVNMILDGV